MSDFSTLVFGVDNVASALKLPDIVTDDVALAGSAGRLGVNGHADASEGQCSQDRQGDSLHGVASGLAWPTGPSAQFCEKRNLWRPYHASAGQCTPGLSADASLPSG